MMRLVWALAICLALVAALRGQQQPPTLGPSTPTLQGPGSSRGGDLRMLAKVRRVYIEWIDNNLNEKLADDLAHVSWLKVVDKPDEADAVIRGSCYSLTRLKRLNAEVYLNDRVSGKSIWQDSIHVPFDPPDLSKAVNDAAAEILAHLNQSIRAASRR
ncbi:MAG TPA: hypothetical protein VFC10_18655 [Terriglobia bacterium]|jgi:hypothetical protein|nr:hypothetical protein [Terriglobia bacterium]